MSWQLGSVKSTGEVLLFPPLSKQMESTQEMSGQFVYRELCIVCKNKQNQL